MPWTDFRISRWFSTIETIMTQSAKLLEIILTQDDGLKLTEDTADKAAADLEQKGDARWDVVLLSQS